uniref:Myrosinase 1-like n=1 Tax=Petromyzon marinus TaxID=7757 RepID=A0AAJ7WX72_PETMA|nr:myrosinase 1-like [Petromyzon marinus]
MSPPRPPCAGGWNADGKGESVWDHFVHTRPVFGGGTGDVTCDSYHRIAQDMVILNGIGLSYYRFSISWSRIFPKGDPRLSSGPNEPGVRYYNDLINNLTSAGIQPMVTLFHWDLPQVTTRNAKPLSNPSIHSSTHSLTYPFTHSLTH